MQINYFTTKWCFCSRTDSNTLFIQHVRIWTHKRTRRLYQDLSLSLLLNVADLHFRACDNHLLLQEHMCAQNLARTFGLQVYIYLCICIEFGEKFKSMVLLISERWRTLHPQLFVNVCHEKCFECERDIRADDTIRAP